MRGEFGGGGRTYGPSRSGGMLVTLLALAGLVLPCCFV